MITIFTPSFADEADTNAQNLSVKEIVARLDPSRIAVTMFHEGAVDPRIAVRPNTKLIAWNQRGNTLRTLAGLLLKVPDVYFFPREGPLDGFFLKCRRCLRLKTALVTYVVSGGLYSENYVPARLLNIREADEVIANNTYLSRLVYEKIGVAAQIIYDGVDRRYFFPQDSERRATGNVTVLYAGSLRPYKRVPLLVKQAARWPNVRFRIAGTGEEDQTCRALAAELHCWNVKFLGHLTSQQLGDEMRSADIFFFPSMVEGHPQVLGQANACGIPSVAMKVYRPDYVLDGKTGFLAANDEELAERLGTLILNPDLRRSMGEAAIAHAEQFDWDRIAKQWQGVLEGAAERRCRN
jgi:glycosyltransferase involved in cell wall biosynthesis